MELCWQREASAHACAGEPLAAGASTLGASFVESYGVWYALCARATIGNAAYEAGVAATAAAPTPPMEETLTQAADMSMEMVEDAMHMLDADNLEELSQEM
jgi:hypothetical protein